MASKSNGTGPVTTLAVLLAALFAHGALAATPVHKLDAQLLGFAQSPGTADKVAPRLLRMPGSKDDARVRTILRYTGTLDEVKAQGAVVRSVMGDIATVEIPAGKLAAVAALPRSSRVFRVSQAACMPCT